VRRLSQREAAKLRMTAANLQWDIGIITARDVDTRLAELGTSYDAVLGTLGANLEAVRRVYARIRDETE